MRSCLRRWRRCRRRCRDRHNAGEFVRRHRGHFSNGHGRCPRAIKSTPARTSAFDPLFPIARRPPPRRRAAGRARPCRRRDIRIFFWMSLTVIRPLSSKWSSTTSSFSMRCWCSNSLASRGRRPAGPVTRLSLVITSETWSIMALLEAQIAIGQNADQLAVLSHRQAGDAVLSS